VFHILYLIFDINDLIFKGLEAIMIPIKPFIFQVSIAPLAEPIDLFETLALFFLPVHLCDLVRPLVHGLVGAQTALVLGLA